MAKIDKAHVTCSDSLISSPARPLADPLYPDYHTRVGFQQLNGVVLPFQLLLGEEVMYLRVAGLAEHCNLVEQLPAMFLHRLLVVPRPRDQVMLGEGLGGALAKLTCAWHECHP